MNRKERRGLRKEKKVRQRIIDDYRKRGQNLAREIEQLERELKAKNSR